MEDTCYRMRCGLFVVLICLGCIVADAQGQTPLPTEQAQTTQKTSLGAQEVARLTGVAQLLERFEQLPESERRLGGTMSLEALALRQQITETVLGAALEADGVLAEIDSELERIAELNNYLAAQRDHQLLLNGIANVVTGGVSGVVGTALQFNERTANLGNGIGVGGGAVSVVLSLIGIRQQGGGKRELRDSPNMLAQIFDREDEFHSHYPDTFWRYLNSPVPTEPEKGTRRERLRRLWEASDLLDKPDTPKGKAKLESLTSRRSEKHELTLAVLNDRTLMLMGVRTWAELMKRDLWKLLTELRTL